MNKFASLLAKKQPIFLDSSCFIYAFEINSTYNDLAVLIFDSLSDSALTAETSTITISEVVTKPIETKNEDLISRYIEVFDQLPNLTVRDITTEIAHSAARIRAEYSFKLIDCIQLAVASNHHCGAFVTNDSQLKRFKQLPVICLSDFL